MSLRARMMARFYDRSMRAVEEACLGEWRRELLADLEGRVLEIGSGTGVNLGLYPDRVEYLTLCEPEPHMRRQLEARAAAAAGPRTLVSPSGGERLEVADASCDAVVAMLVLCSVQSVEETLAEVARVLRPGGRLVFLEHVAAEERPGVRLAQRLLQPLWRFCAGNCHLTRRTLAAIESAGFEPVDVRREPMFPAPAVVRTTVRGSAHRPA